MLFRIAHYAGRSIQAAVQDALTRAYGLRHHRLRAFAITIFYALNQVVDLLVESWQGRVYLLEGVASAGGLPLRVACIGNWAIGQRNTLPYFQHLWFQEGACRVTEVGTFPAWQTGRQVKKFAGQVDLVAQFSNNLLMRRPTGGSWITSPSDIRMVFDFHPGERWQDIEQRMKGHEHNIAVLKRSGYTYRVSRSEDDFHFFYDHLHVPMVKTRYGAFGDVLNKAGLLKVFKENGFLFLVEDPAGEVVSGALQYCKHGVMYGLLNGLRDGNRALVRKGALAACYYFAIQWAFENGIRRFDAGTNTAFVSDGIYTHKQFWGFRPVLNLWRPQQWLLWTPNDSPAALPWLRANRVLPGFGRCAGAGLQTEEVTPSTQPQAANRKAPSAQTAKHVAQDHV